MVIYIHPGCQLYERDILNNSKHQPGVKVQSFDRQLSEEQPTNFPKCSPFSNDCDKHQQKKYDKKE